MGRFKGYLVNFVNNFVQRLTLNLYLSKNEGEIGFFPFGKVCVNAQVAYNKPTGVYFLENSFPSSLKNPPPPKKKVS